MVIHKINHCFIKLGSLLYVLKKELILKLTQYYIGDKYSHIIKVYLKMSSMDLIYRHRENTTAG